jgi:hypothetical protein
MGIVTMKLICDLMFCLEINAFRTIEQSLNKESTLFLSFLVRSGSHFFDRISSAISFVSLHEFQDQTNDQSIVIVYNGQAHFSCPRIPAPSLPSPQAVGWMGWLRTGF